MVLVIYLWIYVMELRLASLKATDLSTRVEVYWINFKGKPASIYSLYTFSGLVVDGMVELRAAYYARRFVRSFIHRQ